MARDSRDTKKKKVVEVLNKARSMELQAIYQYMNQHYNLDNMGTPAQGFIASKGGAA